MSEQTPDGAKLTWTHPRTKQQEEFILTEGATASIGRLADNDICIPEQHVSRRHAVITYDAERQQFLVKDMGSANGTYLNDQPLTKPAHLKNGDTIRLYVPEVNFSTSVTEHDRTLAADKGTLITAMVNTGKGKLIVTTGPQEGNTIPLLLSTLTVGRVASEAHWEIALDDSSVSRPHARLELEEGSWRVVDLGSANGTLVNGNPVGEGGYILQDGDIVAFGATLTLFRVS